MTPKHLLLLLLSLLILAGVTEYVCTIFVTDSAAPNSYKPTQPVRGNTPFLSQIIQLVVLPSTSVPVPSPGLLFFMGFLGVGCVIINERRRNSHDKP